MPDYKILRYDEIPAVDRGTGVATRLMVGRGIGSENVTTAITAFAPGTQVALHWHNCDESVVVLEGETLAEVDGQSFPMRPYDTTFVPAGVPHRFRNPGDRPARILAVYAAGHITRTFADTGQTVEHLSPSDRAAGAPTT